ncbi:MAG TPA: FAD-dependent oxidoreductase [Rhizomicrobium sp.]|jgi:2-polyprenyl-6-methoxyphenol hydroxylase-like FAD-dependent oxidoreductase|nr:FAD-dependent oxidoreductase [Rhizomicrobium sp.]
MSAARELSTRCCIAGGGPAGMMLGYLLARAGIDVIVLEKWKDFFRDFRGDTIHPSTMEVLRALGLLENFLALDPDRAETIGGRIGGEEVTVADFAHLPVHCRFIALIPQWDFLDFLGREAQRYPGFHLHMETEAADLLIGNGAVGGVSAKSGEQQIAVRAELVVGADGRHSTLREKSGLRLKNLVAPIDVLWFRLSRRSGDPDRPLGVFDRGRILVMIKRKDYWQCGYVIPKGDFDRIRAGGLERFRAEIAGLEPAVGDRVQEIESFESVKLLSVVVDRLADWSREGLLCIGDAAHAMSPIGGVGINLATQDAVAAANILVPAFRRGKPRLADLKAVQRRREFPTVLTQAVQVFLQNRVLSPTLASQRRATVPFPLRLAQHIPALQRIPARAIGLGVRPEMPDMQLFLQA